jgi:hypothetical protein
VMAHLLLASCYPAYKDILYDNPHSDLLCSCETCAKTPPADSSGYSYSGCNPETTLSPLLQSSQTQPLILMSLH